MKRKILGCLLFVFAVLLVGCQGEEVKQETPKEVAENFVHTLYDIDYKVWAPQFEEYLDSLDGYYEKMKLLIAEEKEEEVGLLNQEQFQSIQELYRDLANYMHPDTFEDSLTKNSFSEPRQACFDYQANSRVVSIEYDETFSDEQSVGYFVTVNYEISLLHEDTKKEVKQNLNVMIKKQEDNSWKMTAVTMSAIDPIVFDRK